MKCLILILLGIALIINPANGWDQVYTKTSSTWSGDSYGNKISFWVNTSITRINVSGFDDLGWCKAPGSSTIPFSVVGVAGNKGNITFTWDASGSPKWITADILDFDVPAGYENAQVVLNANDATFISTVQCKIVYSNAPDGGTTYPNAGFSGTSSGSGYNQWTAYPKGVITAWSGSDLPDAPVINDFTKDKSCYYPYEGIILESDVTGDVDSWTWEIYDQDDQLIDSSSDAVETILGPLNEVGMYNVQLTVENTGGSDFLLKEDFVNITISGTCTGIGNWTPFPTVPTVTPTSVVYPTMTVPPVPFINKSGINDMVNESLWGNYSAAYRKYIDEVGDSVNQTVTGATGLVMTPFAFIVQGIAVVLDLFSTSLASLMVYTTVPLSITSRVINVMPWQMQSIITAGLAIDAIFLLVLGKG